MPTTPDHLHANQITRALPRWSTQLSPAHASTLLQSLRKEYLDAEGQPYSWFASAPQAQQLRLRQAIEQRDLSRKALAEALSSLQGINDFCTPLLEQALGLEYPVLKAQYSFQPWELRRLDDPTGEQPPLGGTGEHPEPRLEPVGPAQLRSLLAAALHNFEGPAEPGPLSHLQQSPDDASPLPGLTLGAFVRQCRALDLGQQYQAHLAEVFEDGAWQPLMMQADRDELAVRALIAHLQGLLTDAGYQALLQLCQHDTPARYKGRPVACRRMTLFATPVHQVLVIGPVDQDQVNPCIVYTPGDPVHPVREYPSLRDYSRALKTRLADSAFQRLLIGYAPQRLQPALARQLQNALYVPADDIAQTPRLRPDPHLDYREHPLAEPFWQHLADAFASKLREDARVIAVPTADVDAQARQRQFEHWLALGLDLLNVAAMFIPVLSPLMLAIGAAQVMGEVFHGIEDWEDGDTAQALAHVESLLLNVVAVATLAGGAAAIKASGFVEQMRSVFVEERELLWHPNLAPYRNDLQLPAGLEPNALGQYTSGGKTFIRLDGELFEQYQDADGQWRIRNPRDPAAYSPRLRHNGKGAWRLDLEHPLEWDTTQLLRRLGPMAEGLEPEPLQTVLRACATDPGVLRRMQVAGEAPPALLEDALLRMKADLRLNDMVARTRYSLPLGEYSRHAGAALVELPGWPEDHLLQVFEGSEAWGAATLHGREQQLGDTLVQVTRTELDNGELAQTVLNQLDDAATSALLGEDAVPERQAQALRDRLAEHLQGKRSVLFDEFYAGQRQPSSAAAQVLARQFTSLPANVLEEIVAHASVAERQRMAGQGRVPLRIAEEARHLQARLHLDRAILGLAQPGLANLDTRLLRAGLQAADPEMQGTALFDAAVADRSAAARLIGQQPPPEGFRSPLRLSDGRLGYPLSGRSAGPVERRLRALYPELDRNRIRQLRAGLGSDPASALRALENQYRTLERDLARWTQASADIFEREHRAEFARRMTQAWRQEGGDGHEILALDRLHLPELPSLTARFGHIRMLRLDGLDLQRLDSAWLECFPNLRQLYVSSNPQIDAEALFEALKSSPGLEELHLTGNQLAGFSDKARQALRGMRRLRVLNLRRNQLVLNLADVQFLAELKLDTLGLAINQITLDQAMATAFQDLVHTRILLLDYNPLRLAPDLSFMARLERLSLASCELSEWPTGLTTLMSQQQYQLRNIDLSWNDIADVPALDTLLETPFARDLASGARDRRWLFNYNGLQSRTRLRLLGIGVAVFEDHPEVTEGEAFWTTGATPEQADLWTSLFDDAEHPALLDVLERLAGSAEAQRQPQILRARVWALLARAGKDTELREQLETLSQTFPATCGDAGADAFSALEIEAMAYEAGQGKLFGRPQLDLYRRLYRRAKVNELADRIAFRRGLRKAALADDLDDLPALDELDDPESLLDSDLRQSLVDDIEIRLALRQGLAETLDYPEPSLGMLFAEVAQVSERVRENVAREVRLLDADAQARLQWTAAQPAWQAALKRHYAAQFQALTDYWRAGLDYLDYCLDPESEAVTLLEPSVSQTLTQALGMALVDEHGQLQRVELDSERYTAAVNALLTEQKAVEDGLLLSLTRGFATAPH